MWPLPEIELSDLEKIRLNQILLSEKLVPTLMERLAGVEDKIKRLSIVAEFSYARNMSPFEMLGASHRVNGFPVIPERLPNSEDRLLQMLIHGEIIEVAEE